MGVELVVEFVYFEFVVVVVGFEDFFVEFVDVCFWYFVDEVLVFGQLLFCDLIGEEGVQCFWVGFGFVIEYDVCERLFVLVFVWYVDDGCFDDFWVSYQFVFEVD